MVERHRTFGFFIVRAAGGAGSRLRGSGPRRRVPVLPQTGEQALERRWDIRGENRGWNVAAQTRELEQRDGDVAEHRHVAVRFGVKIYEHALSLARRRSRRRREAAWAHVVLT